MKRYFGKYRGKVEQNVDLDQKGRIQVSVPAVLGANRMNWAMPCVPYAGPDVGFLMIPPRGAHVWVEFENGDPRRPIWSGCFWDENENSPATDPTDFTKIIKTDTATIMIDDTPGLGGITIETSDGLKLTFDATGIELTNGSNLKVTLDTVQNKVSINGNALEVT
jgi:uncharacterized protein involved in type VI secretion and phage assembly